MFRDVFIQIKTFKAFLFARKPPMSSAEMVAAEFARRIRWQVLLDARGEIELWADLPAHMTPTFERAARASLSVPFRFSAHREFEYQVCPLPTQTSLRSGEVRRMQRIVVLSFY